MSPSHTDVPESETAPAPADIHGRCRMVTPVLARIGDKWTILVIMALSSGSLRFNALKRMLDGISQRMLTLTLRTLERDGLVTRTVTPSIPPRVDYELTPLGDSLRVPITALGGWVMDNLDEIERSRAAYDGPVQDAE